MQLILVLVSLAAVNTLTVEEHQNGVNGWYIPQQDGSVKWMDMADVEKLQTQIQISIDLNAVTFNLFTRSNRLQSQSIEPTKNSIIGSNFNGSRGTRFIIHGWTSSQADTLNENIKEAWLSKGDYNIIVVDWARARSVDYATSVLAVPGAGAKVGNMISYLQQNHGLSLDTLHVIGHSLGAHVSGHAGKTVGSGKIHTIIGLDPAFPLFMYDKPSGRLANTDAYYVESIQTNGGTLGFLLPIGKAAFYPNGGQTQPGCGVDIACSHGRSTIYYAEAVAKNDFPTVKCVDYKAAVAKNCGSTNSNVRMGSESNANNVNGVYYVAVNSKAPFGTSN